MGLNLIGLAAAISTFVGVWFGHVAVRRIEAVSPTIWLPAFVFAAMGLALEWLSIAAANDLLSAACGILGFTFLWDALEFTRQQNRVKKGHAPANPNNPRHIHLLREHSAATTLDLLKRDPIGRPVSRREAIQRILGH